MLLTSNLLGDREPFWVVIQDDYAATLEAEEAQHDHPRPALLARDILRLRAKPSELVRAAVETLRAFPGATILR